MKIAMLIAAMAAMLAGCISEKQWADTGKMHAVYMQQQRTFNSFEAVGSNMTFTVTGADRIAMSAPLNPLTTIPQYPEFAREVADAVKTVAGYGVAGYLGGKMVDGWTDSVAPAAAPAAAP
jgi:hypothetical protein